MAGISQTVVKLQPGKMEEVTKYVDEQAHLVNETEGMIGFAVAVTGEDELTVTGIYERTQNAHDAAETVAKVFSGMASAMAAPPERQAYSGVWFGS